MFHIRPDPTGLIASLSLSHPVFSTFIGTDFCQTVWLHRNFTILTTAILLIWPICYFKRLDFLRYVR